MAVPPWYFELMAIVCRKLKDYDGEVAILERYLANPRAVRGNLDARLDKARAKVGKPLPPPPSVEPVAAVTPGWYEDPWGDATALRYHDGSQWTLTSPRGAGSLDAPAGWTTPGLLPDRQGSARTTCAAGASYRREGCYSYRAQPSAEMTYRNRGRSPSQVSATSPPARERRDLSNTLREARRLDRTSASIADSWTCYRSAEGTRTQRPM